MSAPDTNVERQAEKHKPSLLGIGAAVVFALVSLGVFLAMVFDRGGEQDAVEVPATAAEVQAVIDGTAD
ncbi:hypothetical protein K3725_05540 [Leisingera sp. S132]|uniref:hypothetical protein n=1 Tax=Leisingera sp. S132 TaxID=2867016 RepID=UPI0021A59A17|nr:hypothetical protein [Leisingera sp. S132]UWQ80466.1 hypothetical protein K3725_05540 [Leisingera sp. S132]